MTTAAPLYRPLQVCGYALGVFPYTVSPSAPHRFRRHWFGAALKAVHLLLFWSAAVSVNAMLFWAHPPSPAGGTDQRNGLALDKKLATTSPGKVDELYVYMMFTTSATAALCQLYMMLPSVVAVVGECLLRPRVHHGHVWPPFKAFTIVAFVVSEFAFYYVMSVYWFNFQFFLCLFSLLSNIDCMVVEQFFYITCLTLCVRLKRIHEDVQDLVHKAEHPRWRCWTSPAAGHPDRLGIPAFGAADIRHLRFAHLGVTETFSRVNRAFQLPLLLNMIDSVYRILFYTSEVTYHLIHIILDKRTTITYGKTALYSAFLGIRVVRLWYLHSCEYYITKMIIPIRISLSWLTLTLNPVTSRRLMPEIILFQNQLDAVTSKFQIYGMININIALFYAEFGLLMAYIIFLLQFFGSTLQPSLVFNNFTAVPSIMKIKNSTNVA
ncbi:uncharacterized protein LOC114124895 isoform X1 [Aphis gossypii]|uniref:uncharacterized protein LOC114124895 isoform X1 n=1 Tax=Aphis gossypii TaxID=80765 RepID=UPI002159591A|nr:uncharacterized protein LOC114124895 isoform X1 [Aphis gossypii]